jgi:hypothetical protein
MTRADNSAFLAQAGARRHQAALPAAHHAIEQLQTPGTSSELQHRRTISRRLPGDGSTAKTRSATSSAVSRRSSHRPPAGPPRSAQPPARPASGSMPPAPRSPACEPRTAPSATSSPATSASSGHNTPATLHANLNDRLATNSCGEDTSTPQKCPSTRHYLQTTLDNRRYGRQSRLADRVIVPRPNDRYVPLRHTMRRDADPAARGDRRNHCVHADAHPPRCPGSMFHRAIRVRRPAPPNLVLMKRKPARSRVTDSALVVLAV